LALMPRELSMSLNEADLGMVGEAERLSFEGVSEGVAFLVIGSGTLDPYTQEFVPAAPRWTIASGTFSILREGDALLGMSGKLKAGDSVAKFYYPDVVALVSAEQVRREATGEVFSVEMRMRTGLGPAPTRLELGLKPKPNE
jgi:hypothetical protein